ncbi:hypothetical protein ACFSQJ_06950 [Croceitalea marina]|uniref:Gliding motility-associated protein GldM N-terminal domain-containing protein n=1 Tax=Croceitalea marina TaxID=1775166 RepID=A0ABW5MTT2_9FLAO
MINFFRKIRKNGLKEGKVTKYLLYALGEILLVVIGILIALWINNKSENAKALDNEKILIQKLEEENKVNLNTMKTNIEYRTELPSILEDFSQFLASQPVEEKNDLLVDFLDETLQTSTYSYPRINLTNYINLSNSYYSDFTKELTILNDYQKSLEQISEKGAEIKIENFITPLKSEIDFNSLQIASYDIFKSLEFKNNIILITSVEEEITRQFDQTYNQAKRVDSLIAEKLKY